MEGALGSRPGRAHAGELAQGAGELAQGAGELAQGAGELAQGAGELAGVRAPWPAAERTLHIAGVTYALRPILCGKATCSRWHGPYWYAFTWDPKAQRTRCRYIGKRLPADVAAASGDDRLVAILGDKAP